MNQQQVKAAVLSRIDELKKEAQDKGDVDGVVEATTLRALVETEGKKLVEKPPYRVHVERCLLEGPPPKTQAETREKMKKCAEKWVSMPEEEKQKIGKELEIRNP